MNGDNSYVDYEEKTSNELKKDDEFEDKYIKCFSELAFCLCPIPTHPSWLLIREDDFLSLYNLQRNQLFKVAGIKTEKRRNTNRVLICLPSVDSRIRVATSECYGERILTWLSSFSFPEKTGLGILI